MKILIVQDYLRSGGTERQSILLANAFTAAGHPTTLLTFRPGGALDGTVHPQFTDAYFSEAIPASIGWRRG